MEMRGRSLMTRGTLALVSKGQPYQSAVTPKPLRELHITLKKLPLIKVALQLLVKLMSLKRRSRSTKKVSPRRRTNCRLKER